MSIEWNKKETEFFLVGDSFTHGNCVNEPHTISGNLRSMLKQGGVLNLGQGGNGPLIEYASLREYLPGKKIERIYDSIKSGILNNAQNLGDLFLALPKIVNKLNLFDEIDHESV